jgi:hypothetical protein
MTVYAKIENNLVVNIILADSEFIESGAVGNSDSWIDTTTCVNAPSVGATWLAESNGFSHPQPWPNWIFDTATCEWMPPVARPDGQWFWDQHATKWIAERGPFSDS